MADSCSQYCNAKLWYENKIFIAMSAMALLYGINRMLLFFSITSLNKVFIAFWDYLVISWWLVLIGLLLGGVIDYFVPPAYISKHLGKNHHSSVVKAVILGFSMSACSHGILAIAVELYRKGASTASVIAFLLASPWANFVITFLLFGFFGWKALLFVGFAIIIALITGFAYKFLDNHSLVEHNPHTVSVPDGFSMRGDIKKRLSCWRANKQSIRDMFLGLVKGSWGLAEMVVWWMVIGMFLAAAARVFIPADIFASYLGPTLLGMAVVLILAVITEVCSEGSAPIAFEIFRQTGAFGNAFIFLMGGVVTDYTEIGLIWANIGRKAALWLPIITVPQVLVLAYIFNLLL